MRADSLTRETQEQEVAQRLVSGAWSLVRAKSDGVAHDGERGVLPDDALVELILELEDLARRDTHNILKAERTDSVDGASKRQAATTATQRLAATANPVTYPATDPVTAMKPAPEFFDAQ
eukprot:CAMPEP_0172546686 /NCGR_PEP_ID=MMETSP1067-20121228/16396_1 /TAXON_ID=265564 ORGANISM="Thalassiosira punctigera, Strain Tpunct2005C2" /NCGR_SAMPLE_ID=MMETSP1067 /ASSEMBLY_ACC=CAM_ASM_000444 /LENGTH=119 /DNA_ID=CAMNT_0013333651 /DNA_START=356 /DNA_END=713 /DNA_ORIENTATION=-